MDDKYKNIFQSKPTVQTSKVSPRKQNENYEILKEEKSNSV
jgi:hypothetical protein